METSCGVAFLGDLPVPATVELAQQAESLGVGALWLSETHFERNAWTTLVAIALNTDRVTIGTSVVPIFITHPAHLAMSFATLDELSSGRVIAGIGTGVRDLISDKLNYDYSSPLTAMREAITIIRAMLAGETLDFEGRFFSARKVDMARVVYDDHLGVEQYPSECRVTREIPIHIAAVGPKMCALAGELADGVHLGMAPSTVIRTANEHVTAGRQKSVRPPGQFDRVHWTIAAVHTDPEIARNVAREHVAYVLTTDLAEFLLEESHFDPAMATAVRQSFAQGGIRDAVTHVTDAMVAKFAAAGTASEVTEKVEEIFDAGVTHPVLVAFGPHAANVLPVAARFGGGA